MSSPTQPRRSSGDGKKNTPPSNIVTRNGARKAKIQTRAMSAGAKPSAVVVAAKKKAQQRKKNNIDTELRDYYQIAMESKNKIKGPTGLVTEPRMAEHACLWDENYPECPGRLISVINRCHELNLIDKCKKYPPRAATQAELSMLHSPLIYDLLLTTHRSDDLEYLEKLSSKYDAVYIHPSTHELALLAAGSTVEIVDRILSGEVQNGAALMRPPGHHAMAAEPCGYCFYNNVAIAARHATDNRGLNRILIVDWDVHHGQATQQMFYDDPRVVYFSIHRYEQGSFWPNLRQSDFHYIGAGAGKGYNFNVPLNKTGMTDGDYMAIWHQLLLPMAFEYQPELIIVSAGYDAAVGCPEGEMEITPACYAHLTNMLMSVCPRVCVVLEGGYCLASLAEGAALTLRTLLGHPPPRLERIDEPSESIKETILNCIYSHRKHWNCYPNQQTYTTSGPPNVCDVNKEKHIVKVQWDGDETRPEVFATRDCYPLQDDGTKAKITQRLNHLRLVTDLSIPQHAVCYVYDQEMLKHKNIVEPDHVECPERIMRIHERHRDFGLLERVHHLAVRPANDEEILSVHTERLLKRLKELSTTKLRDLNSQKNAYDSVYFHPESLQSAAIAAGGVIQAVDSVLSGESSSGVCVVRPPGHHADEDVPSGFCLLNNAAIAAHHAIRQHGVNRVIILDWDVHHGNGTQRITYHDERILYISIHRYDNGSFFPHSKDADYTAVGEGRGVGYNVNIPWNKRGMGDTEYMAAFTQVVLPIAYEYNPELVIVSAGFDACVHDPLGGCKVTPECYGRMTQLVRGLAGGRVVVCLEGGYNVTSISYAMAMCTKALFGDPIPHHYEPKHHAHWSAVESIFNVIKVHKKYWKCLKFQVALPAAEVLEPPLTSRGLEKFFDKSVNSRNNSHLESLESNMANLSIDSNLLSYNKSTDSISNSQSEDSLESNMANLSIDNVTSLDNKSIDSISNSQSEDSLESNMANLKLGKCYDGIHCGTDDEDTPQYSKIQRESEEKGKCSSNTEDNDLKGNIPQTSSCNGKSKSCEESIKAEEASSSDGKKTLVDYLAENMQAIVDGEMFAVIPMPWCPHLDSLFAIPSDVKFEPRGKCVDCDHIEENWVCLHCYVVACARSINGHMQAHYTNTSHPLVLSLVDLSVWCNECDAYVDNALLYDAKNNAHRCKFGEDMPWCYKTDTIQMG
ncbi:hypothetical protein K1T71_001659 [Dendrolimus kikuchii]|uniref:Uncharacterized protein n=1 Tax=Dendrolimus kikuchii TaxID=765133 RepID=A0ACC1DER7_9NEOP|nr:hypothetical protein K1T71_001659 [Dendrolimus kikuchii]